MKNALPIAQGAEGRVAEAHKEPKEDWKSPGSAQSKDLFKKLLITIVNIT